MAQNLGSFFYISFKDFHKKSNLNESIGVIGILFCVCFQFVSSIYK
jgi:hypothetical protein